jgi:hypothetical protein
MMEMQNKAGERLSTRDQAWLMAAPGLLDSTAAPSLGVTADDTDDPSCPKSFSG